MVHLKLPKVMARFWVERVFVPQLKANQCCCPDCRAGAFLSPLYSSIRGQVTRFAEKKAGPIFHGGDVETKGVTGLAISSAGV